MKSIEDLLTIIAVCSRPCVMRRMDSCAFEKFRSMAATVSPSAISVETVKHIAPVSASL